MYDDFSKMWKAKHSLTELELDNTVLIIDEISMVSGEFFDCVLSQLRDCVEWGANSSSWQAKVTQNWDNWPDMKAPKDLQLIVFGDFLQLPPIPSAVPD